MHSDFNNFSLFCPVLPSGLVEVHVGNAAAVRLVFTSSEYTASVTEDEDSHSQILILKAVRSDGNLVGLITYSIISGNEDGAFEITRQSGMSNYLSAFAN